MKNWLRLSLLVVFPVYLQFIYDIFYVSRKSSIAHIAYLTFLVCHQVGLMLRGMGFDKSTFIFLASGKIYDAERNMAPLLEMFPLLQTKEMLASQEELAPFQV